MNEPVEVVVARIEERQIAHAAKTEAQHVAVMQKLEPLTTAVAKHNVKFALLANDRKWTAAIAGILGGGLGAVIKPLAEFLGKTLHG